MPPAPRLAACAAGAVHLGSPDRTNPRPLGDLGAHKGLAPGPGLGPHNELVLINKTPMATMPKCKLTFELAAGGQNLKQGKVLKFISLSQ